MTKGEKNRKTRAKNRAYATKRALRIIKRAQPKTLEEAQALGIGHLQEVGQGAFRTAYRVYGTSLLIKFPITCRYRGEESVGGPEVWHDHEGKNHTRMEVKKIRILCSFRVMRKHIPPVYYYNGRDGVMVTKYYPKSTAIVPATNTMLYEMVREFCGVILGDLSPDNIRTEGGNLMFIDCGY